MLRGKRVEAAFSAADGFDCSTRYESRNQRRDAFERIGLLFADGGEVVHVLEVEPVFGRGSNDFRHTWQCSGSQNEPAIVPGLTAQPPTATPCA